MLLSYVGAGGLTCCVAARARARRAGRRSSAGSSSRSRRTGSGRASATCSARSRCCSRSRCSGSRREAAAGAPSRWSRSPRSRSRARSTSRSARSRSSPPTRSCAGACASPSSAARPRRSRAGCSCSGRRSRARSARAAARSRRSRFYSAKWSDFVHRGLPPRERELRLPRLAHAARRARSGSSLLVRGRRVGLAAVLARASLVPSLLALGTHLPSYSWLWQHVGPFRYPRVPERLMPIACLSLAALVAFALPRRRVWAGDARVAIVLLAADLHVHAYGASAADRGNAAYTALRGAGRVGCSSCRSSSRTCTTARSTTPTRCRRRASGRAATRRSRPSRRKRLAQRLERLNCGDWTGVDLAALGVRFVTLHQGQFTLNAATPNRAWFASLGLARHGWRKIGARRRRDAVDARCRRRRSRRRRAAARPPRPLPGLVRPERRRRADERDACAALGLRLGLARALGDGAAAAAHDVRRRRAPGRPAARVRARGGSCCRSARSARWHLVTLDVPRLAPTKPRATGVRLLSVVPSLDDGDDALFGLRAVLGPERRGEPLLELAGLRELLDDVRAADELALDEHLRDRRPAGELARAPGGSPGRARTSTAVTGAPASRSARRARSELPHMMNWGVPFMNRATGSFSTTVLIRSCSSLMPLPSS